MCVAFRSSLWLGFCSHCIAYWILSSRLLFQRLSEAILVAVSGSGAASSHRHALTRSRLRSSALLSRLAHTMLHAKHPPLPAATPRLLRPASLMTSVSPLARQSSSSGTRATILGAIRQTGVISDTGLSTLGTAHAHEAAITAQMAAAFARRRRRRSLCGIECDMLAVQCDPELCASGSQYEDVAAVLREQLVRPHENLPNQWCIVVVL